MTKINIEQYLADKTYRQSQGYVQPDGSKFCACCDERKYAVEFLNVPIEEFMDGKLPVCIACWTRKDGAGRMVVQSYGVERTCEKCGHTRSLIMFPRNGRFGTLGERCLTCEEAKQNKEK